MDFTLHVHKINNYYFVGESHKDEPDGGVVVGS